MNPIGKYKNFKHLLISLREIIKNRYPARNLVVIGITGTDGKTTTAHLTYEILRKAGLKVALISTVAAYLDNEIIDTGFHTTTPDARVLQPLFRKLVDRGVKYVVLEATSHGLDQHRLLGANFWAGVLTNVSHEHLDYHKTIERYKAAKAKLFRGVKVAVLNRDDPSFDYFKARVPNNSRVISYSVGHKATLCATRLKLANSGMTFSISESVKLHELETSLVGQYNVSNILAAVGVARALKVTWPVIARAVKGFRGVEGRMETVDNNRGLRILIDFAHTPNALQNLLETLSRLKGKGSRLIAVLGSAGERDFLKRPAMGEIAAKFADISIFTAEDPRSEDVNNIIDQMLEGAKKANNKHEYFRLPERGEAIKKAIDMAHKGDIVVICGKGHERSMAYNGVEYLWSDQEAVKLALKGEVLKIEKS
ncbi:MAG: UDP-N-acetylmuramoyl-L-alanyl-D-glutamate--2,6-diaminopimelate ligase [bacterium]|nr:UDP-N-acetylmuramoyl-L-alanyl-D-glutamate--2,6-diaminopimelate ligase [bacterium]